MKYWVYKDTRILGPLDKGEIAGIPGMDAATLVCPGESAASEIEWRPAGEIAELGPLDDETASAWPVRGGLAEPSEEILRSVAALSALTELPAAPPSANDLELRRAQERVADLGAQIESLRRRIAEFETGQFDLRGRAVEEYRVQPSAPATGLPPAAPDLPPAPPELPSAASEPPSPEPPSAEPELPPALPALPEPEVPPGGPVFEHKSFRAVSMAKMFRVVGAEEHSPDAGLPASTVPPVPAPPSAPDLPPLPAAPAELPASWNAPPEPAAASAAVPPPSAPAAPEPGPSSPPPFDWSVPPPSPPATLAFGAALPTAAPAASPAAVQEFAAAPPSAFPSPNLRGRFARPAPEPATAPPRPPRSRKLFFITAAGLIALMAGAGFLFLRQPKDLKQMAALDDGRARVGAEAVDETARPPLVKPQPVAPAPQASTAAVGEVAPPAVGGTPPAVPPAGASADAAAPAGPSEEAAQAASQDNLNAVIRMVKDFPLDGEGRGTVADWLQFSYSASPDAGKESWNASETGDKTFLVEYRFVPASRGSAEVHYLFEADMARGLVLGKNAEAKSMLAGGSRAAEEKPKPKPAKKRKTRAASRARRRPRRAAVKAAPGGIPLLPLPTDGQLQPPAEDEGAFGSDPVNSSL